MGYGFLKLILYSTDHCTLCDRALELLFSMPELAGQAVEVVDVATDDALLERYGERLPVLEIRTEVAAVGGGEALQMLAWPFDPSAIVTALNRINRG